LTEAGRITLDHAEAIFATGDELLGTLKETGKVRQAIRLGALATLSRNFQISFVEPLLARTDIEVVLRSGSQAELLGALQSLAIDVVLTDLAPASDALAPFIVQRLSEQPVSLVGAPALLGETRAVADLLRAHPVVLPASGSGMRIAFDAYVDRLDLRPQIAAEVDDMAMMRLIVREGHALGVLPPIAVRDEIADGALVEAEALPGIAETFLAVTTQRRFPNPVVRQLIDRAMRDPFDQA
ncbi:MAG: LysR family transcriptional regulator substrate-binding protein, partial [Sphingomonadales bacterium]|nr:LysR family transcriptional regulator substrate-binding protein [Sphingomonadales bacterium]